MMKTQVLLISLALVLLVHPTKSLQVKRQINGRALYDDIVRRINSGAITNPQPIVAVPAPANVPNLGVALFNTPAPAQLAPVATPSAGSIYTANSCSACSSKCSKLRSC